MKYSIGETAQMTGVTIRALRHYDKIGLLRPAEISESGYRYYTEKEIAELQQILFYRELDFSLEEIKNLLSAPENEKRHTLKNHIDLLIMKRRHINSLIRLASETLGGHTMSKPKITTEEIEAVKNKYAAEVREKWGDTAAFAQSEKRLKELSDSQKEDIFKEQNEIFAAFAECAELTPDSREVQSLVKCWQDFISKHYYDCSNQILSGLGKMYMADERFKANLDSFGDGTALIMSEGIKAYCCN